MKTIDSQANRDLLETLLSRNQFEFSSVNDLVLKVIETVRKEKDQALIEYTARFDKVVLTRFKVTKEEIEEAYQLLNPMLIEDLKLAMRNMITFHQKQVEVSYKVKIDDTSFLEERVMPIEKVGLYVPGGTAPLPSTVLMNAVPAKLAGVKKTVMVSPPNKEGKLAPSILVAADLAGVDEIYKIGGAQAVAALAFGTETIPKVDKIVGPGNVYVTTAKRLLNGYIGIDMIAGPSEILIIADDAANPEFVAADLLSQAEHDTLASAILLTPSKTLAKKVNQAVTNQIKHLSRKQIVETAIANQGLIVITKDLLEAIAISNRIAPEHLEIMTKENDSVLEKITQAGAIFIGNYSPEPLGDYFAGTNHTLPTSGTARFSSPLSVRDFMKRTQVIYYTKEALEKNYKTIVRLANEEGLTAHASAITVRFKEDSDGR